MAARESKVERVVDELERTERVIEIDRSLRTLLSPSPRQSSLFSLPSLLPTFS